MQIAERMNTYETVNSVSWCGKHRIAWNGSVDRRNLEQNQMTKVEEIRDISDEVIGLERRDEEEKERQCSEVIEIKLTWVLMHPFTKCFHIYYLNRSSKNAIRQDRWYSYFRRHIGNVICLRIQFANARLGLQTDLLLLGHSSFHIVSP